jgi:hypothetical protein
MRVSAAAASVGAGNGGEIWAYSKNSNAKSKAITGMAVNASAAARYATKGIGLTSEERMDMPVLFAGKKQSLMFGTAVNARSVERWSMCTTRTAFASTAGRAR